MRRTPVLAVLALLTAFPAAAQEFGGVPLQDPGRPLHSHASNVLGKIRSTLDSGCPLAPRRRRPANQAMRELRYVSRCSCCPETASLCACFLR